jgi:drug/metabolite transporter (DMT)-like permease
VSWAAYGMLLRRWSGDYPSVLITRKMLFYGILMVLPMVISAGEPLDFAALLSFGNIARLAYLVLLGNALCFIFWNSAVGIIGVLKANMYIYMIPLLTLVVSALALGERITVMGFAGIVLVILGMFFATEKKGA